MFNKIDRFLTPNNGFHTTVRLQRRRISPGYDFNQMDKKDADGVVIDPDDQSLKVKGTII